MRQYKDDLLASCLQLLLSLPNELVRHEFQALVPALQVCSTWVYSERHQFEDFFTTIYIWIHFSFPLYPSSLPHSSPFLFFSSLTSLFILLSLSLQSTFKLGLSFLSLANAGLDALEAWNAELPAELLKPHFRHILPYLDDYLKTLGVAGLSQ